MSHEITTLCTGCTACVRQCPVDAISGERKQLHQIDAALCIDCGACGRICPVDAILDTNRQTVLHIKPALWEKPVWNYATCTACKICVQACPTGCIAILEPPRNGHGFAPGLPYLVRPKDCIACTFCVVDCPFEVIRMASPEPA